VRGFDRRLLKYARSTRSFLIASMVIQTLQALLIVAQAFLLAAIIVAVFTQDQDLADVMTQVMLFGVVILARALTAFAAEWLSHRTAATAMSELRMAAWKHMMSLGPAWLSNQRTGELAQLLVRGIGGLEAYYARYLPQLVLAVTVPLIVGVAILTQDLLAAVIVGLTVPLIPIFMILVGWVSQARVDRQWRWLSVLGNHFLDVVEGLPTLKAFNRAQHQVGQIRKVGEEHRRATMGVLRITFLSALVLELLSTLSVALIAVSIGVRLVEGNMTLMAGLTVLILAPEVYLPLRMVGQHFHAAAEGADAADRVFSIMEQQPPATGSERLRSATVDLRLDDVELGYDEPVLTGLTADIPAGRITVINGPSGVGKTTVLNALLGFLRPMHGRVLIGDQDLAGVDVRDWWDHVAWVPQSPVLLPATLLENLTMGADLDVSEVLRATRLDTWVASLPEGLATVVGEGGRPVSVGQARRIALSRALLRKAQVLMLDEPTAGVDPESEAAIVEVLRGVEATVIVVGHRSAINDIADQTLTVGVAV
jgi:ATP-binding cassette subfamily C protein CydD/ATP-binding cassette subfamily C protein CydCD